MNKLLLLFLPAFLFGQTTITGTMKAPTGELVSGTCLIQAAVPFSAGSSNLIVIGNPVSVKFTNGQFSVSLTQTPTGQWYKVNCSAPDQGIGNHRVQAYTWPQWSWWVPGNLASPAAIKDVLVAPGSVVAPPWPTGPKGDKGDKGDPGAQGDPGITLCTGMSPGNGKVLQYDAGNSCWNAYTPAVTVANVDAATLLDGCLSVSGGRIVSSGIPCGTGSGGSTQSWSTLTSSVWSQISNTTWSSIIP